MNWLTNIILSRYNDWRNKKFDNSKIYNWSDLKLITDTYFRLKTDKFVISIGNLSFGGTGKTPCIETLVKNFLPENSAICIIERGYNRKENSDLILDDSNFQIVNSDITGDEPLMLYNKIKVPISISQNKFKAFYNALESVNPEIIIIDDGYQHRWIERDLNILLLDENTLNNPNYPPKGRLRESLKSINRADIILIPMDMQNQNDLKITEHQMKLNYQIKLGEIFSHNNNSKLEINSKLVAVSGIANPKRFISSLKSIDLNIIHKFKFSDHYNYTLVDIEKIIYTAEKNSASVITTEKDFVKLFKFMDYFNKARISIYVLPIEFEILDTENILKNKINEIYQTKIKGEK